MTKIQRLVLRRNVVQKLWLFGFTDLEISNMMEIKRHHVRNDVRFLNIQNTPRNVISNDRIVGYYAHLLFSADADAELALVVKKHPVIISIIDLIRGCIATHVNQQDQTFGFSNAYALFIKRFCLNDKSHAYRYDTTKKQQAFVDTCVTDCFCQIYILNRSFSDEYLTRLVIKCVDAYMHPGAICINKNKTQAQKVIDDYCYSLDDRSLEILLYYFGFADNSKLSASKIAEMLSLTNQRVYQIISDLVVSYRESQYYVDYKKIVTTLDDLYFLHEIEIVELKRLQAEQTFVFELPTTFNAQSKAPLKFIALDKAISDIDEFPARIQLALTNNDIKHIGDLVQLTQQQLLQKKGAGRWLVRKVKQYLDKQGLSFDMSIPSWTAPTNTSS